MDDVAFDPDQDLQLALFDFDEDGNPDVDPEMFEPGGWYDDWNPLRDVAGSFNSERWVYLA